MENPPKISVIIPARNEEAMVGRALESIQNGGVLGGLFFCEAELFKSAGGYDNSLAINENADIVQRFLKRGGKYKLITNVFAYTSMRRFEEHGMWRALLFWCMVKLRWFVKSKRTKIGNQYAMTHDKFYSSR